MRFKNIEINGSYKRIFVGMLVPYFLLFMGYIIYAYIMGLVEKTPHTNLAESIIGLFELMYIIVIGFLLNSVFLFIYSLLMDKVVLKRFSKSVYLSMLGSLVIIFIALEVYFLIMLFVMEHHFAILEPAIVASILGLMSGYILYLFYPSNEED